MKHLQLFENFGNRDKPYEYLPDALKTTLQAFIEDRLPVAKAQALIKAMGVEELVQGYDAEDEYQVVADELSRVFFPEVYHLPGMGKYNTPAIFNTLCDLLRDYYPRLKYEEQAQVVIINYYEKHPLEYLELIENGTKIDPVVRKRLSALEEGEEMGFYVNPTN